MLRKWCSPTKTRLEAKHNDFRLLMEEYHDGILLFELTDQKVWSRAVQDSAGLVEFHAANPDLFMWPKRLDVGIHTCEDETIARVSSATSVARRLKDCAASSWQSVPWHCATSLASLQRVKMRLWTDLCRTARGNLEPDSYGLRVLKTTEGGTQIILVHLKERD